MNFKAIQALAPAGETLDVLNDGAVLSYEFMVNIERSLSGSPTAKETSKRHSNNQASQPFTTIQSLAPAADAIEFKEQITRSFDSAVLSTDHLSAIEAKLSNRGASAKQNQPTAPVKSQNVSQPVVPVKQVSENKAPIVSKEKTGQTVNQVPASLPSKSQSENQRPVAAKPVSKNKASMLDDPKHPANVLADMATGNRAVKNIPMSERSQSENQPSVAVKSLSKQKAAMLDDPAHPANRLADIATGNQKK